MLRYFQNVMSKKIFKKIIFCRHLEDQKIRIRGRFRIRIRLSEEQGLYQNVTFSQRYDQEIAFTGIFTPGTKIRY